LYSARAFRRLFSSVLSYLICRRLQASVAVRRIVVATTQGIATASEKAELRFFNHETPETS
jgi:hypothetical protein